jgi:hypothetical protein
LLVVCSSEKVGKELQFIIRMSEPEACAPVARDPVTTSASRGVDMVMALVELRDSVQGLNQDIAGLSRTVDGATRAVRTLDRKVGAITMPMQAALFEYTEKSQRGCIAE